MQPECIQAYVLSIDCFVLSSILGSENRGRIGGQQCHLWVRLGSTVKAELSQHCYQQVELPCACCGIHTAFHSTCLKSHCILSYIGMEKGMGGKVKGLESAGL